jgi:signal transduction histidine kinase
MLVGIAVVLGLGMVAVAAANYRDARAVEHTMAERQGIELVKRSTLFTADSFDSFLNEAEARVVAGELTHFSLWTDCRLFLAFGSSAFPRLCPTPFELQRESERSRMTFDASVFRTLAPLDFYDVAGPPRPSITAVVIEFNALGASAYAARALMALCLASAAGVFLTASSFYVWRLGMRARRLSQQLETRRHVATLGTLSAVLAHELRNPLAALKGNLQLLAEQPSGPKAKAQSERAVRSVMRLERVVRELLEFARSGAASMKPTSPAAVLHAAVQATGASVIEIVCVDAPAVVSLDGNRLQQALINLLQNALDAAPGQRVLATLTQDCSDLVYDIRDHGPGIAEADRTRIFEPFFTTRARGTGLGLAIAKRIVELHGGRIDVDDAAGGGARVSVRIPLAQTSAR